MGNRIAKLVKPIDVNSVEKGADEWTLTLYARDAQGNPMSTYKGAYQLNEDLATVHQIEKNIYGSSRVGMEQSNTLVYHHLPISIGTNNNKYRNEVGDKAYELSNHLGNVLTVVSDYKIPETDASGNVTGYLADIISVNDYYPFGMSITDRSANNDVYRYSFQGQEADNEIKGAGNSVNYKYRMHDTRIGRFFAVDPLAPKYPHYSPYSFSGNKVIHSRELEGLEDIISIRWLNDDGTILKISTFINNRNLLKSQKLMIVNLPVSDLVYWNDIKSNFSEGKKNNNYDRTEMLLYSKEGHTYKPGLNSKEVNRSGIASERGSVKHLRGLKGEGITKKETTTSKSSTLVMFDNDIRDKVINFEILDKVVRDLKNSPDFSIVIDGYASMAGEEKYNQTLSEDRAKLVKDYLMSKGISENRILSATGHGETEPLNLNDTEGGDPDSDAAKENRVALIKFVVKK